MTTATGFTPSSAAIRLTHWLDAAEAVGAERFPVPVETIALDVGRALKWPDSIVEVKAVNVATFEGGLFHIEERNGWALLYNNQLGSPGRVRFTQAHELGHYLLHKLQQDSFECSQADMVNWGLDQKSIEAQADEFASTLLMPLKQFRNCVDSAHIEFDMLSAASAMFGVSLTATCLRWIRSTEESAVLVLSRDGFIDWSVSSDKARANGAFFRTRGQVVELPTNAIAADSAIESSRMGTPIPLKTWFEHAHHDAIAREMKLTCDNYGYTLSLLHLSGGDKVWAPREWGK